MAIDIEITDNLFDIDMSQALFAGPFTASAVAITAGQLLEYDVTNDVVQLVTDATSHQFIGIATKDYAASATDVITMFNVTAEVVSAATHDASVKAYGFDGGGVTAATSESGAVGVFVGLRGAVTTGRSRVYFTLGLGPALS